MLCGEAVRWREEEEEEEESPQEASSLLRLFSNQTSPAETNCRERQRGTERDVSSSHLKRSRSHSRPGQFEPVGGGRGWRVWTRVKSLPIQRKGWVLTDTEVQCKASCRFTPDLSKVERGQAAVSSLTPGVHVPLGRGAGPSGLYYITQLNLTLLYTSG